MRETRRKILGILLVCLLVLSTIFSGYHYRYYVYYSIPKNPFNYFTKGVKVTDFETYLKRKKSTEYELQPLGFNTNIAFPDCNVTAQTFKGNCADNNYYVVLYNTYTVVVHAGVFTREDEQDAQALMKFSTSWVFEPEDAKYITLGQGYLGNYYTTLLASDFSMSGINFVSYIVLNDPRGDIASCVTVIKNGGENCPSTAAEFEEMIRVCYSFASTLRYT